MGTYHWVATYNGDANNTPVSSACGDEPVTITQATPTIATNPSAGGVVGTSIFDTATVSGGVTPTGTVTFNLFGPGDADLHGDAGVHVHRVAGDPPDRRDLRLLHDHRRGHIPLGRHLQR